MVSRIIRLITTMAVVFFCGCSGEKNVNIQSRDLADIKESGKLVALTGYSATSYFIYRGQPMGFEYELLQRLGKHLGVEVEIKVTRDMDKVFDMLNNGEGDIIASGMARTKDRMEKADFTLPYIMVKQVLVQRKPDNWRKMKLHEIEKSFIRNPVYLVGEQVHVRKESSYYKRLKNLEEEIGGDIGIVETPGNLSTEELIRMVADGEIDFTVADENIAMINQSYYSNIDVATEISLQQRISWVVRNTSPQLKMGVNFWIETFMDSTDYYVIYNKYFKNRGAFRKRVKSEYFSGREGGGISQYDTTIQTQAKRLNWDWRLLASQIYQESQFDPEIKSWAGAVGLMQLMPPTAKQFGATKLNDPFQSIEVGVNYLKWLDGYWAEEIPDTSERLFFVLSSYNAGYNHIADARRLVDKYGGDSNTWHENVDQYLLRLMNDEFFNDEVVKFGYCRGREPVNYVEEILARYGHYKKLVQ
ncbi:MAG: transporter substrate-binding domain-containing protein [Candidatus Electryonea clarkiae]|nr:transporter substrate-binding domain-containing protein [Candidatus Electryonea clarkiae]MDP8289033.1 transporter substrate-binding domain-containing protein [Candidatus Electryonea clarkiae]